MKARSVARELALFALFQREGVSDAPEWDKATLHTLVLNAMRMLRSMAEEQISEVGFEIGRLHQLIQDHEIAHPDNKGLPLELSTSPVPVPTTHEMAEHLERLAQAIEALQEALYLPEMEVLSAREDVINYTHMLIRYALSKQDEIDARITEAATDWRVDRLQKMDKLLLRLATAELTYSTGIDIATVVDEYLELAKRFTSDESRRFIHGVLGGLTEPKETAETEPAPSEPETWPVLQEEGVPGV